MNLYKTEGSNNKAQLLKKSKSVCNPVMCDLTHDKIADICAKRLRNKGYRFSFSNLTSMTHREQPDVLGIDNYGTSVLVEVKVSRSDFFADKKKLWRTDPTMGMGDYRVYLTPQKLLNPDEIPFGWMLWEIHGKRNIIKVIKGKLTKSVKSKKVPWPVTEITYPNTSVDEYLHFVNKNKNYQDELTWLIKIMSRAQDDGIDLSKYANNYQRVKKLKIQ